MDPVAAFARGQEAERMMRLLGPQAEEAMLAVDRRIFALLKSGQGISVDVALQAWYEKYALHTVFASLTRSARAGHGAAARLMEGQNGEEEGDGA